MIETESRAFGMIFVEHEILMVLHVLLVFEFHPIESILNILNSLNEELSLRIIELRSLTCNMRRDKFLTDWVMSEWDNDLIPVLKETIRVNDLILVLKETIRVMSWIDRLRSYEHESWEEYWAPNWMRVSNNPSSITMLAKHRSDSIHHFWRYVLSYLRR